MEGVLRMEFEVPQLYKGSPTYITPHAQGIFGRVKNVFDSQTYLECALWIISTL